MSAVIAMKRDNLADLLEAVRAAQDDLVEHRQRVASATANLLARQKALGEGLALCGLFELGDWVLVRRTECSKEQLDQAAQLAHLGGP